MQYREDACRDLNTYTQFKYLRNGAQSEWSTAGDADFSAAGFGGWNVVLKDLFCFHFHYKHFSILTGYICTVSCSSD